MIKLDGHFFCFEEYKTLPELNKITGVKTLPSVSTIFKATDPNTQRMVKLMKEKNTKQGQAVREAVSLGNSAHKVFETKKVVKTDNTAKNLLMEAILEEYNKSFDPIIEEVHAKEKGVFLPFQYKGKFDSVGIIEGKKTLWDYKKTNAPKRKSNMKTYFKQICAYALAHNNIYEDEIEQVGVLNIFGKTPEQISSQVIMLSLEELEHFTNLFKEDLEKYNNIIKLQEV
jgi:hypothetical protein